MSVTPPDISLDMIALFNDAIMRIFSDRYMDTTTTSLMLIPQNGDKTTPALNLKRNAYIKFLKKNGFIQDGISMNTFVLSAITAFSRDRDKFLKNVREFIKKMEVQIDPRNNNIEVTLHDRIRRGTIVNTEKSRIGGILTDPSYHCESLKLFMAILTAVLHLNQPILKRTDITLTFEFLKGLFGSGLVESVKNCSGKTVSVNPDLDPVSSNIYQFIIDELQTYADEGASAAANDDGDAAAHNDDKAAKNDAIPVAATDDVPVADVAAAPPPPAAAAATAAAAVTAAAAAAAAAARSNDALNALQNLDYPKNINSGDVNDVLGGSKSRRIRRRKHRRKTHHKHSRKTRHKRTHRSRTARKHKKYSRKH